MRSRFGQRLGKDHSWGENDPARNIPDLLGDAWHERCFRQRHPEEYRDAEYRSISPGYPFGAEQILYEIGTIGDNSIDLTRGDPLDLVRFVDCPRVHLVTATMKRADNAARNEMAMEHDFIRAAPTHGDEQRKGANRPEDCPRNRSSKYKCTPSWAMTRGKTDWNCRKRFSQQLDCARISARDVNFILKLMPFDRGDQHRLKSWNFHIEEQRYFTFGQLNCFIKGDESWQNSFQQLDWRGRGLVDHSFFVGMLQVMYQHELPIAGGHEVELDSVDAKPESG